MHQNRKNYAVTFNTVSGTVSARPITVTAATDTKTYDGGSSSTGVPGITTGSLATGDTVSWTQTFSDKNVGAAKTLIAAGTVSDANSGHNYAVTFVNNTNGVIKARSLTVTAASVNKQYDANTSATVTLSDNRVSGDVFTANYTSASFADKNVATGKPVSVSGISISGTDAGNYTANPTATATANITARALKVSATGVDKVYDGTLTATVNLSDDRISGDVFTDNYTGASFAAKKVATGTTVSVSGISISGIDAANYSLSNTTAMTTANITTRPLTISAAGVNRTYNGTTGATVTLSDNRVSGDAFTDSYTIASFADKNVGTGKTVSVSGISISGTDSGNYTANSTAMTTANITQASVTITVANASRQYSDPNPTFTGVVAGFVTSDGITVAFGTSAGLTTGPGSYPITATATPSAALGNYNITNTPGTLTITQEDASAAYSGLYMFTAASTSSSSVTAPLTVTITDMPDGSRGDITKASVTFTSPDSGATLCASVPVVLVTITDPTVGTATCNATLAVPSTSGGTQYTIGFTVGGYYTDKTVTEDALITAALPLATDFITGGGYTVNTSSFGTYAGDAGQKTNFGFNVKYNKSGTNLQGNMNIIVRSKGHVYQFKGNSMSSLSVSTIDAATGKVSPLGAGSCSGATSTSYCQASFLGKANITDITDPNNTVSLGGNASLQVDMIDTGNSGTDTIGITVLNNGGGLNFSSNWDGSKTVQQKVGGGNLSVH